MGEEPGRRFLGQGGQAGDHGFHQGIQFSQLGVVGHHVGVGGHVLLQGLVAGEVGPGNAAVAKAIGQVGHSGLQGCVDRQQGTDQAGQLEGGGFPLQQRAGENHAFGVAVGGADYPVQFLEAGAQGGPTLVVYGNRQAWMGGSHGISSTALTI